MNLILLIILFLVVGYSTGILIGMLGIGGGIIFVPLLYFTLPYTGINSDHLTYIVIATSVFSSTIGTISSAREHFHSKNIDINRALLLGAGSIVSAFFAPLIAINIPQHTLQIIFGIIFLFAAAKIIFETNNSFSILKNPLHNFFLILFGLGIGLLTGFAGIGGGILFVPALAYLFLLDFKKAIGTSSMVTVLTTLTSTVSYSLMTPNGNSIPGQIGYVYLLAGIPLGLGSAFGAINGVKFVMNSSIPTVKKIFSVLLIVIALKIIFDL